MSASLRLSGRQIATLRALAEQTGPVPIDDLPQYVVWVSTLYSLERRGLVERQGEHWSSRWQITRAGREAVEA